MLFLTKNAFKQAFTLMDILTNKTDSLASYVCYTSRIGIITANLESIIKYSLLSSASNR